MKSISDYVFDKIESDILNGVLVKGDCVSENKVASEFKVSRTPVREAIKRLEHEGLVEYSSTKSVKVLGISKQDVLDSYDIRIAIESQAAVLAAHNMTDDDYNSLKEIVELQSYYIDKKEADNVKNEDTSFHRKIYELSKSSVYQSILTLLHKKIQQYRKKSISKPTRGKESVKEHFEILKAMKEKNDNLIIELVQKHLKNAKENIENID